MIYTANETLLTVRQAAKRWVCNRTGKETHPWTILVHIKRGARNRESDIVRLEAVKMGGHWVTSVEAIQRFAEALTGPPEDRAPAARRKASKPRRAGRELAPAGK